MTLSPPTSTEHCPLCEAASEARWYGQTLRIGRRAIQVQGLQKWVCRACAFEFTDEAQSGHNLALIESMTQNHPGAVTPGLMRRLRQAWGLTQAMASKVFGAGDSSFAKWESGQSNISRPSALLIQTAVHVPGAMEFLAHLAQIPLKPLGGAHWVAALQQAKRPQAYQNWRLSVEVDMAVGARLNGDGSWGQATMPAPDAYRVIAQQARLSGWHPQSPTLPRESTAA